MRFSERCFNKLRELHALDWIPDETFLKLMYRVSTQSTLNLSAPRSYNEKLQWLKLYDRNPAYTVLVDKVAVRKYVEHKLGGGILSR